MQEKIGVCIVGNGDSKLYNFVIENLKNTTSCSINIYHKDIDGNYTETINDLLKQVQEKYCVIFPINAIVDNNWCEDLLHNIKTVNNPGIVGIRKSNDNLLLVPILFDEELKNIWMHEDNFMNGIMMFKTNILTNDFGLFENIFETTGFESCCFSLKFFLSGLNNFYIRKQTYIPIEIENNILFPKKSKQGIQLLNEFMKANLKNQLKKQLK